MAPSVVTLPAGHLLLRPIVEVHRYGQVVLDQDGRLIRLSTGPEAGGLFQETRCGTWCWHAVAPIGCRPGSRHSELVRLMTTREPAACLARPPVGAQKADAFHDDVHPPAVAVGTASELVPPLMKRSIPAPIAGALQEGSRRATSIGVAHCQRYGSIVVTFSWQGVVHAEV